MTTKDAIKTWLAEGKARGATHTLIVCDTFDYEDFPIHVMPGQSVRDVYAANHGPNMQRVMEVYSHSLDHKTQLDEGRAFHFD